MNSKRKGDSKNKFSSEHFKSSWNIKGPFSGKYVFCGLLQTRFTWIKVGDMKINIQKVLDYLEYLVKAPDKYSIKSQPLQSGFNSFEMAHNIIILCYCQ